MAGGEWSCSRAISAWVAGIAPQIAAAELAAVEPGDLVVAGVLSIDDAVALQEACGCLAVGVLMAPVLPTASGPSATVAVCPHGRSRLNRWVGRAALAAGASTCTTTGRHLREQMNLPRTGNRTSGRPMTGWSPTPGSWNWPTPPIFCSTSSPSSTSWATSGSRVWTSRRPSLSWRGEDHFTGSSPLRV